MTKHVPSKTLRRVLKSAPRVSLPLPLAAPLPAIGRPRVLQTPEELDTGVEDYARECDLLGAPYTLSGLALFLGFDDKDSLREQATRPGFSRSVKRALALIERTYESRLHMKDCIGAIFALKNMGWTDRQDINVRGVIAGIDLNKFTDEQLRRVKNGEHPLTILSEVRALPPSPPPG